jgi:hypothetical protein
VTLKRGSSPLKKDSRRLEYHRLILKNGWSKLKNQ